MGARRRALLLAVIALAAVPAYAISQELVPDASGPAQINVSASLGSCGVIDDGVACQIQVSFDAVAGADSYSATVTRPDGSVIDYGAMGPGGASIWVPYVGAGTYSVRITAYGEPPSDQGRDGRGKIIATGSSKDYEPRDESGSSAHYTEGDGSAEAEPGTRGPQASGYENGDGEATTEPGTSPEAAPPECPVAPAPIVPAAPVAPEEPPQDLDPLNDDEDADGVLDETERQTYEQQLAEYQAALDAQAAAAAAPAAPAC